VARDVSPNIEYTAPVRSDVAMGEEIGMSVLSDGAMKVESLATAARNDSAGLEYQTPTQRDATLATDVLATVNRDSFSPADILGIIAADSPLRAEWAALLSRDTLYVLESQVTVRFDMPVPAQVLAKLVSDDIQPVEWGGQILISADMSAGLEWSTTTRRDTPHVIEELSGVAATSPPLSIESSATIQRDTTIPVAVSAFVVLDRPVPAEFNIGRVSDQVAVAEWLRSVFGSAAVPNSTLAAISVDDRFSTEYVGGGRTFIYGNTNIFHIDARGTVFMITPRGTVFTICKK
jgi:hypothetical protein